MPEFDQKFFRRILYSNLALPIFLGLLSAGIFLALIFNLISVSRKATHANLVIADSYRLAKIAVDAETGLRGYAITSNNEFLEPYDYARLHFESNLNNLRSELTGNEVSVDRLNKVKLLFRDWLNYANRVKTVVDRKHEVNEAIRKGRGKGIMDQIRDQLDEIIDSEGAVQEERKRASFTLARLLIIVVGSLSLIFAAVIAWYGRRQMLSLAKSYESVLAARIEQNRVLQAKQWIKNGQTQLAVQLVGEQSLRSLTKKILETIAEYVHANLGAIYVRNEHNVFERMSTFAYQDESDERRFFHPGEGLIGRAALKNEPFRYDDLPNDYVKVVSGLGDSMPRELVFLPITNDSDVTAVLELGFLNPTDDRNLELLKEVSDSIGSSIKSAHYRERLEKLLREVQNQSEELQTQQEELRVSNEELEEHTHILKASQARIESQQTELEQTNAQLEDQARTLEMQKDLLNRRNEELQQAQAVLERRAQELQQASQYKSEFLANMSHELRTPLNSSLILAKLLADNNEKNLTPQQIEFARQIQTSGNDLLNLINDILDLSKVESGKLDIHLEPVHVRKIASDMEKLFSTTVEERALDFNVKVLEAVPDTFVSDQQRVEQILKNLLSNALKFTSQGEVELKISFDPKTSEIRYAVRDTGIGIKKEQQEIIFEAFRQADGTTNRRFGGTGLGLSISRDLARLLGGHIEVQSEFGTGSTFTLVLPEKFESNRDPGESAVRASPLPPRPMQKPAPTAHKPYVLDDREDLKENNHLLLIVEDDPQFATVLRTLSREQGFQCIITNLAEEAVELAKQYKPNAVLLDIMLKDHVGLYVLDQLKRIPEMRHVPVHVVSGYDFSRQVLEMGAIGFLQKPVDRQGLIDALLKLQKRTSQEIHQVLVVENNKVQQDAIHKLIAGGPMQITAVSNGHDALKALESKSFDCMIMDLSLADMSGFELLDRMNASDQNSYPPVIVYTGQPLTEDQEDKLRRHAQSVIIKGARSPERLLDEVTLFLHQVEAEMNPSQRKILSEMRDREKIFESRSILVVDDDMRNCFALASALEQKGARVVLAKNGEEALKRLETDKSPPDIILMDIMMPVMDGFEAMRRIRQQSRFKKLPIIALTAKAMRDDRERCLDAGADDYLAKPVDLDKLLSLIRIWLSTGRSS